MSYLRLTVTRAIGLVAIGATTFGVSGRVDVTHAAHAPKSLPAINIAMISDINTLDPAQSSSFYDRQVMNNIYDKLFDLNSKRAFGKFMRHVR